MKRSRGIPVMALILGMTISFTACSTDWVGQGEQIAAALVPAATNVVALVAALEGKSVSAQDLQMIQTAGTQAGADLQLIQVLISQYQKADTAARPGILNKIQTAIGAVQTNLEGLLGALHIKDTATQAKITAVVGIVLSEVQSLAAIVPLVQSQGSAAIGQGSALPHVSQRARDMGHPKAPLSAREFVTSYNATMTAKTGKVELDGATAGLQIQAHGKLARVVTAGVLK